MTRFEIVKVFLNGRKEEKSRETVFSTDSETEALGKYHELSDIRTHELDPHYSLGNTQTNEVVYDTRYSG